MNVLLRSNGEGAWLCLAPCAAFLLVLMAAASAFGQPPDKPPQQVNVSVKIIEFQTTKGSETGLSAFFARRDEAHYGLHGWVIKEGAGIRSADFTFPTTTATGISVFLDRLRLSEGDLELILQALVSENRASILSQPKAMVMVGGETPTKIKTVQTVPYESTKVVGATTVQITEFHDTGVTLEVSVPEVIDDDGDWTTADDTFIMLDVHAEVMEEGQRIVVALDDQLAGGAPFSLAGNAISVPEFVSRSIMTKVWMRHGQVLILGGLFRNTQNKSLSTLPWLTQAEDLTVGAVDRLVPGEILARPLSSILGNREKSQGRRELVFMIKSEIWRPAFTVLNEPALLDDEQD